MARSSNESLAEPTHPGWDRSSYDLGTARLTVTLDAGPRIIGYALGGHGGPFADLPDVTIEHPAIGTFWFIGGHRLWRAPEVPEVTYQTDIQPVQVDHEAGSLTLTGSPDSDGVVKILTVRQDDSMTIVDHTLHNMGSRRVRTAVWGITQLQPGGAAILPASPEPVDDDGLLPNRTLTLWPYSDLSDPGVTISQGEIRVGGGPRSSKFKIGQANRRGWMAYGVGEDLFVKWAPVHDDDAVYPHLGSSVECYRDARFVELESVGPLSLLDPGEALHHREVWTMFDGVDDVAGLLASLPADPVH